MVLRPAGSPNGQPDLELGHHVYSAGIILCLHHSYARRDNSSRVLQGLLQLIGFPGWTGDQKPSRRLCVRQYQLLGLGDGWVEIHKLPDEVQVVLAATWDRVQVGVYE